MSLTRYPAFTNGANVATTTIQVYRLEKHDSGRNEFKHYTGYLSDKGHAFFGFSRIGASYQWNDKGQSASAASIVAKQIGSKKAGGYESVWNGDIEVPMEWADDPKRYGASLQQAAERARMEGQRAFGGAESERDTPLAGLIEQARSVVSKVAADPDSGVREYGALVDAVAAAQTDLDVATNYIDTLRLMLAGAGKGAA